tara:strand:- start:1224 stop:1586 length:363 start_codon:yes stop_codon:yes gene_type:complete
MDQNEMMLDYLMQMGEMQPQQQAIQRKQGLVDRLRQGGSQMPGMRGGGHGFQTAANPLEFLAPVAQSYLAQKGEGELGQMSDAYGRDRRGALAALRTKRMPNGPGPLNVDPVTGAPLEQY